MPSRGADGFRNDAALASATRLPGHWGYSRQSVSSGLITSCLRRPRSWGPGSVAQLPGAGNKDSKHRPGSQTGKAGSFQCYPLPCKEKCHVLAKQLLKLSCPETAPTTAGFTHTHTHTLSLTSGKGCANKEWKALLFFTC